jgi:A/G-specific adenine glycosylase
MRLDDRDRVLGWYHRNARDLPWRRTRDPYRILVSEVMLQQTQVARVVGHYERFLAAFSDERALAGAPVADVLRVWSGLGYNRRALRLREAAAVVAERGWPRDAAGLRALPGVGAYTAAAVASIAFGEPVAAIDTNAQRVLERTGGRASGQAELRARAARLVPADRPGTWTQALMELGATVCTARTPRCDGCPVRDCVSRGRAAVASRTAASRRRKATRFEDTDRYVRGRIVAALVDGQSLPTGIEPDRMERDGLVVREGTRIRLP